MLPCVTRSASGWKKADNAPFLTQQSSGRLGDANNATTATAAAMAMP
jgi:hypothetical protein